MKLNSFYRADLQKYLEIMDELEHSLMMPERRETLENCKEALTVIMEDMYSNPDWR